MQQTIIIAYLLTASMGLYCTVLHSVNFCQRMRDIVPTSGARMVKTIGYMSRCRLDTGTVFLSLCFSFVSGTTVRVCVC